MSKSTLFLLYLIVFHAAWTIWLVVGYPRLKLGEDTLLCALINLAIRSKGRRPLCSLWNGERLDYIEARKQMYIPLYPEAVKCMTAYQILERYYFGQGKLTLELKLFSKTTYQITDTRNY